MKPTLSYLVSVNKSIQDINSKKFTLIDTFTVFFIPKDTPFSLQSFVVAGRVLNLPAGDFKGEVKIIDPTGQVLQSSPLQGTLKSGDLMFTAFFNLVKIEKPGKHFLRMFVEGTQLSDEDRFYIDAIKQ